MGVHNYGRKAEILFKLLINEVLSVDKRPLFGV